MELLYIIIAGVLATIVYISGRKSGERDTKIGMAKEISESRVKDAQDEYEDESNMSDDELVDSMLDWLRHRTDATHPEQ